VFSAVDEQALTGRAAWGVLGSAAGGRVCCLGDEPINWRGVSRKIVENSAMVLASAKGRGVSVANSRRLKSRRSRDKS